MATALVTGAAGFIGSHLVDRLLEDGMSVIGLDNYETGRRENIDHALDHEQFDFIEGDLRDASLVADIMDGVEYVFHQGAITSVPRSVEHPRLTAETNCVGTTILLEEARNAGVESVVVASSSAVYGSSEELPKHEDMAVQPESPYALSKYWTEQLAVQFARLHDLNTVALRYFNVYGPRQDPQGEYAAVIPKFIELMVDGERPVIFGDGEQSRDFVHVDDVVEANLAAAKADCPGEVVNIAQGQRTTINGLVDALNAILETDIEPKYDEPRPGDVRHSVADISRAQSSMGFEPRVSFREGLQQTVEWFK